MKKLAFVFLLLLTSIGSIEKVSAQALQANVQMVKVREQEELSIKRAIEKAYPLAMIWNKNAAILQAINIDSDKPVEGLGANGKRKNWNIIFGVPDTNYVFLITIQNGKINGLNDLTRKGTSPHSPNEFIKLDEIKYDSPELLQKALEMGDINPGKNWAKGYNFLLRKDTEKDIPLLLVIGWNNDQTKMTSVDFNVKTGEYIEHID